MNIHPHISRATRYTLFCLVLGAALALSLIRFWLIPQADAYRNALQRQIAGQLNAPVRIGGLAGWMHGFNPQLVLHDFVLLDPGTRQPIVSFGHVRVDLSLWQSLLQTRPIIQGIVLEQARLTVQRHVDGTFGIAGIAGDGAPPDWLQREGRFELRDIDLSWQDLQQDAHTAAVGRIDLLLVNSAAGHSIDLTLASSAKPTASLTLAAQITGDLMSPTQWQGHAYLSGDNVDGRWLDLLPLPARLKAGNAQFRLWGQWHAITVDRLAGQLELSDPVIVRQIDHAHTRQLALQNVRGRFDWRALADGWHLDVDQFSLSLFDQPWPESQMAVELSRDPQGALINLGSALSYLRLEDVRLLLATLSNSDSPLMGRLLAAAPKGELSNFKVYYAPQQPEGNRWGLCGEIKQAGLKPAGKLPGLDHLDARVCGNDRHGALRVGVHDTRLSMPDLWRNPLPLTELTATATWSQTPDKWRIESGPVKLEAPDLRALSQIELDLPKTAGDSPFLSLTGSLGPIDASRLRHYLPLAVLDNGTADWLERAFHGGRIKQTDVLLHGRLADFPFRNGAGVFQAIAEVENLEVAYSPDWPRLYGLNGRLMFRGAGMYMQADSGRIGDNPFNNVVTETTDLDHDPWLNLTGSLETTLLKSLTFLQQTPIHHIPERILPYLSPDGSSALDLSLRIPLVDELGPVGVDGRVTLSNASLALKDADLDIEKLDGEFHFTESSLDARNLRGILLKNPVRIDINTIGSDFLVDLAGKTDVAALQGLAVDIPIEQARGGFPYQVNVRIPQWTPTGTGPLRVTLSSDLQGLTLPWPAPLGKTAAASVETRLELTLQNGKPSRLGIAYGQEFRGLLTFAEAASALKLQCGELNFGRGLSDKLPNSGLRLVVRMPQLDLGPWKQWLSEEDQADTAASLPLSEVALDIDQLQWDNADLGYLRLSGKRSIDSWQGDLDNRYSKGQFLLTLPAQGRKDLKLNLDQLKLSPPSQDHANDVPRIDPSALPNLSIEAHRFFWRDADFGTFTLNTHSDVTGTLVDRLTLDSSNHHLQLKGSWMRGERFDQTQFAGRVKIKDLGQFVGLLGYPQEIRFTPTTARFSLNWPDAPQRFSAAKVSGDIRLQLGRGSVPNLEPGLGRAFGVLNLYTLSRLLLLDFSDLFGKGLSYDSMKGRFRLANGQANTQGFLIDAAAAKILITGRAGLVERDLDQKITVIPHTLATLPMAGAWVGGTTVSAAISVARGLFGQDSVSLTGSHYAVTGSWDAPKIERIAGNMPLDVLGNAWSGFKDISGLGTEGDEDNDE